MELKNTGIFSGLTDAELKEYERLVKKRSFEKGEILFYEGDPPDYLWFIIEGEVKIFKEYASGKSAILGIFGKGSVIAEVAVIDGRPYPATCQAITAGSAAMMIRDDALRIITTNPSVAHRVMTGMGKKLRDITDDLGSMSVQSVIRRLSRFLLKMAEKMGTSEKDGIRLELFLTRNDLAECIGTSFEVVVRCLGRLQNDGIIEVKGKKILIKNRNRLARLADE